MFFCRKLSATRGAVAVALVAKAVAAEEEDRVALVTREPATRGDSKEFNVRIFVLVPAISESRTNLPKRQ